jgi:predicted secreted protein
MQCGAFMSQQGIAPPTPPPYIPQIQPGYMQPPMAQIPNYMVQSVLATLFCCLPLGIVSIFKANEVNRKVAAGDYAGAMAASKANKTLLWVSFGIGVVGTLIYVVAAIISAANS